MNYNYISLLYFSITAYAYEHNTYNSTCDTTSLTHHVIFTVLTAFLVEVVQAKSGVS